MTRPPSLLFTRTGPGETVMHSAREVGMPSPAWLRCTEIRGCSNAAPHAVAMREYGVRPAPLSWDFVAAGRLTSRMARPSPTGRPRRRLVALYTRPTGATRQHVVAGKCLQGLVALQLGRVQPDQSRHMRGAYPVGRRERGGAQVGVESGPRAAKPWFQARPMSASCRCRLRFMADCLARLPPALAGP